MGMKEYIDLFNQNVVHYEHHKWVEVKTKNVLITTHFLFRRNTENQTGSMSYLQFSVLDVSFV